MTLFQYIGHNLARVRFEARIGLVSIHLLTQFAIYSRYDYYRVQGFNYRDAVLATSLDFDLKEQWICKIIKKMEATVNEGAHNQLQPADAGSPHS